MMAYYPCPYCDDSICVDQFSRELSDADDIVTCGKCGNKSQFDWDEGYDPETNEEWDMSRLLKITPPA